MPLHPLTESDASYPSPIDVPDNGDDADADILATILGQLASRSGYLKKAIETTGVDRLREAADLAALAAIDVTSLTTGAVRVVPGYGIYRLHKGVTGAASPWRINAAGGTDRWEHELETVRTSNPGIAFRSSLGQLNDLPIFGTADFQSKNAAPAYTNAGAVADVTGASLSFVGVVAGDILEVECGVRAHVDASGAYVALAIVEPSGSTLVSEHPSDSLAVAYGGLAGVSATVATLYQLVKTYTIVGAGTATVKLRASNTNQPANSVTIDSYALRARLIRP